MSAGKTYEVNNFKVFWVLMEVRKIMWHDKLFEKDLPTCLVKWKNMLKATEKC
jgi:hypothetical protein